MNLPRMAYFQHRLDDLPQLLARPFRCPSACGMHHVTVLGLETRTFLCLNLVRMANSHHCYDAVGTNALEFAFALSMRAQKGRVGRASFLSPSWKILRLGPGKILSKNHLLYGISVDSKYYARGREGRLCRGLVVCRRSK
jgi:hypothetical protein